MQVIGLFLREQLAVGFLTWFFSPCLRVSVREWLFGYLALWLFLRASALSASPREGCWRFLWFRLRRTVYPVVFILYILFSLFSPTFDA
jgi:hypothetical protein